MRHCVVTWLHCLFSHGVWVLCLIQNRMFPCLGVLGGAGGGGLYSRNSLYCIKCSPSWPMLRLFTSFGGRLWESECGWQGLSEHLTDGGTACNRGSTFISVSRRIQNPVGGTRLYWIIEQEGREVLTPGLLGVPNSSLDPATHGSCSHAPLPSLMGIPGGDVPPPLWSSLSSR
jgi:hypothetical protein